MSTGAAPDETIGIAVNAKPEAGAETGSFRVRDAGIFAAGRFAGECALNGGGGIHRLRMPKIQVRKFGGQQLGGSQAI